MAKEIKMAERSCTKSLGALEDALYVIGGKWKLKVIIALKEKGNMRFNELQRTVAGVSAKVLSYELKELEMNGFIKKSVYTSPAILVEYELTGYSDTLDGVLQALVRWGARHREKIKREMKSKRAFAAGK
jgi:DNA-binding HxlR family transcriptional regulator